MTRVRAEEPTGVQEPILSEKRSCLRGGCFSSCGCLAMMGILVLLVMYIAWGPRTINLASVPDHFPASISVYAPDDTQRIKISKAVDVNRWLSSATALPRLVINPIQATLDLRKEGTDDPVDYVLAIGREVRAIFISPGTESSTDRITLTWGPLPDDIEKIRAFYIAALEDAGFRLTIEFDNANNFDADFSSAQVSGSLLIENFDLRKEGIEAMTLTVSVPHQP